MFKSKAFYLGVAASALCVALSSYAADAVRSQIHLDKKQQTHPVAKDLYIVQLKGQSAIRHALSANNMPKKLAANAMAINYDAHSSANKAYIHKLRDEQRAVMAASGITKPLHTYAHTFNGFSVKLTGKQVKLLQGNPDVLKVWHEGVMHLTTTNTPYFLGLTKQGGLHLQGVKGDGVIVGMIDSGINPDHPSFADDGSYSDPYATLGWKGTCEQGDDPTFTCNNKLIGARFFDATAKSVGPLADYETQSPRDVAGHGTHTSSTAAGNVVEATYQGFPAGTASGMAPRARVATYKACWELANPDETGCYYGDTMAAIEAAVQDGVDVINFSIGGSLTDLLTPPSQAFLNAAISGVYVSASAGNEGPGAGTVGMPVPWVTTTAAATYEGNSLVDGARVNSGTLEGQIVLAPAGDYKPITAAGISGDLVISSPADGCSDITNPGQITGKFALIERGGCNFTVKVANAEAAGASAVVVYNNAPGADPIVMAGDPTSTISAVMIGNNEGTTIVSDIQNGTTVNMTLSSTIKASHHETGNIMADFSSRGPSLADPNLLVPDITAPGVKILAAGPHGNEFIYLQGTSMAAPHIAGIGALIKEVHPDWTPAEIQSAIMTSARQNIVKEDGSTPATPFDMGAGYVQPNNAVDPGLVYDANVYDYLGFICGKADEANAVPNDYGVSCSTLAQYGYKGGASYNQPSITVAELGAPRTILRYVTNVSDTAATYTVAVDAPAGFDTSVLVYNGTDFVAGNTMTIAPGQTLPYALSISRNSDAQLDQWKFGSLTWSDGQHNVRIPLSFKAVTPPQLEVAASVQADTKGKRRPTVLLPVMTKYNGLFKASGVGMAKAQLNPGQVAQDADKKFAFNEPGLGFHIVTVDPGTKVLRLALYTKDMPDPATDLDLYVYACHGYSCTSVGQSTNSSSDESVTLMDPEPLTDTANGDFYLVFVHGYDLNGAAAINYNLNEFHVNGSEGNLVIRASRVARDGRTIPVVLNMVNLQPGQRYLGGVNFANGDGDNIGFSLVEADN